MRAAYITELGPASAIRVGEVPDPVPGAGEVRVRVQASAVDAVDTFVRSGAYPTPTPFPFVVGRDLVGVVDAVGDGVTEFRVGDPVWCNSLGHGGRQGAAAESAVVESSRLYRLPAGCDPVRTVGLLHPAATAHLALFTHGRARRGETVFVAGAAGHVGRMTVAMGVEAGLRVVTTSSAKDREVCRDLGAAVALDYRSERWVEEVREAAPDGVDVWLDTSGHNDLRSAVELLAPRGRIVVMSGITGESSIPLGRLYTRDGSILGFAISNATVEELAEAAEHVNAMLAEGTLPELKARPMPLSEAASAHEQMESGKVRQERLVLLP